MTSYASGTEVSAERSKAEIERTLERFGVARAYESGRDASAPARAEDVVMTAAAGSTGRSAPTTRCGTLPELNGGGRWLVVGVDGGAGVAHDGELERACAHFGPGVMVIDLVALAPADTEQEAS